MHVHVQHAARPWVMSCFMHFMRAKTVPRSAFSRPINSVAMTDVIGSRHRFPPCEMQFRLAFEFFGNHIQFGICVLGRRTESAEPVTGVEGLRRCALARSQRCGPVRQSPINFALDTAAPPGFKLRDQSLGCVRVDQFFLL